jgi:hypothetical protein
MKEWVLPPIPGTWNKKIDLSQSDWSSLPALSPFILADGSREAKQQTTVRLCQTSQLFYVRFDCQDRDIWGNYTRRDDPIYIEEAVEVFIAPNESDPLDYYEFEVSPNGVLFDAQIFNPSGKNDSHMTGNPAWDCQGIKWQAGRNDNHQHWWAVLVIPWHSLTTRLELPRSWRANFYRIERPHDDEAEFSCWSPVMTPVADFHRPSYFGVLQIATDDAR